MLEKKKLLGKKAEPSTEELEFIYERLAKGMSPNDILDDMQDESFPLRRPAFITRRKKEFDVAKTILAKKAEGAYDTDTIERKKKHWQRLSDRAEGILNYLKKYNPYTDDCILAEYMVDGEDFELDSLLTDYLSGCFFTHLKNEYTQFNWLKSWDELPVNRIREWDLINILGSKVEKGIFKGKCDICKGWK